MRGHDFAAAHGNDSSTWTNGDFDAELNLVDIDRHELRQLLKQPPPAKQPTTDLNPAA